MVWKQLESGIWTDDLDGAEKVFYAMSKAFKPLGKEHGSVYSVCKLSAPPGLTSGKISEVLLRDSWKCLRFAYPTLSVVTEGSHKIYKAASSEAVEAWAQETFHVETHLSAEQLVQNLHLRKLPCLYFLPQSSTVVFHSSHWRIDALGTCMLLDQLFENLSLGETSSPPWHLEYENLSPSMEDAFGCSQASTQEAEDFAQKIRQRNFESSCPSAGLPFAGDIATPPAAHRTQELTFTAEGTAHLIAACKARGISVTAAIHAACSEVIFNLSKDNGHDYSTVVSVNARDLLSLPYSTKAHACATYVTGINHRVRRADNFMARSAHLTKAYRSDWDAMKYMAALRPIYRVHGEALSAIAKAGQRRPASNVTVSSLGLVERYLRHDHTGFSVDSFRLGSAIMGRQPTLYVWTFRDEMCLSMDFNEAYYDLGHVSGILKKLRRCLAEELEVTLEEREQN
jgi:hypothetical protein